jgi:uncharacterized protein (DUF1015 family)
VPDIVPFTSVRFDPTRAGNLGRVLWVANDDVGREEYGAFRARSRFNIIRVALPSGVASAACSSSDHARAADELAAWLRVGVLVRDARPAMYLCEETFDICGKTYCRRGIVAAVRLTDWSCGQVVPHEATIATQVSERLRHLRAIGVQLSPLLVLYDDPSGRLAELTARVAATAPMLDVRPTDTHAGTSAQRYRVWMLRAPMVDVVRRVLKTRPLVMADGHHRYETALEMRDELRLRNRHPGPNKPYEFVMVQMLDAGGDGLLALPTHRLVSGVAPSELRGFTTEWLKHFDLIDITAPSDAAAAAAMLEGAMRRRTNGAAGIGVAGLIPGRLHLLALRALPSTWSAPRAWREIDVGVLQTLVMDRLTGAGASLSFSRDTAASIERVWGGEQQLAFFLNPPDVGAMVRAARAGDRMPAKSTYFTPKAAVGLLMYELVTGTDCLTGAPSGCAAARMDGPVAPDSRSLVGETRTAIF